MLYDSEVVRVNGDLYAFIRIQNEFTGNVSGSFRRIYKDKLGYYAKADGKNNYMTSQVQSFLQRESQEKEYREFYKKYHNNFIR